MPQSPRVSVLVPTYQRRELVKRAVGSALAQTYRDFELIVVDDGSTDGTREALAPVADRIRYIWKENRGPSAARNTGLRIARGEFIALLDSDNLWLPRHLETATAVLDRNPKAVLATTCPGRRASGRQRPEEAELVEPFPRLFTEHLVGWLSCVVVRREALLAIGGFDERLHAGEDHDIYLRLALQGPFVTIRQHTAVRRSAPDSLHERARRRGDYVTSFEITAHTVAREIEARGDRAELVPAGRARLKFARALRALHEADDGAVREQLRRACELFPRFSRAPDWVDARLRFISGTSERAERLRMLTTAATLWPEPGADSALYLRGHAIALAVRAGHPGRAAALLRGWPLRPTPGFAWRTGPLLIRRAREWVYGYRHRIRRSGLPRAGGGRPRTGEASAA